MSEKQTVTIEVLGMRLPVRTTQSAEEVKAVEALLRQKVEDIQSSARSVDSLKIAVLAAMAIGHDLVETKKELEDLRDLTSERTLALVERLEAETGEIAALDEDAAAAKPGKSFLV